MSQSFQYSFVGHDQQLITNLTNHIPHFSQHKELAEALQAFKEEMPHLVLLDIKSYGRQALRFIASMQKFFPAARIPIIVLIKEQLSATYEDALHLNNHCYTVHVDELDERLDDFISMILDQRYRERASDEPNPHALQILSKVWQKGLTGILTNVEDGQKVQISNGGITSIDGIAALRKALYGGGFGFIKNNYSKPGDWTSVGTILWEAAAQTTFPGYLRQRKHLLLKANKNADRGIEFLTESTKSLLSSRKTSKYTIQNLLDTLKLRLSQVETDIEIICILGLYTLVRNKEQSKEKITTEPQSPVTIPNEQKAYYSLLKELEKQQRWHQQFPTKAIPSFLSVSTHRQNQLTQIANGDHSKPLRKLAHHLGQALNSSAYSFEHLLSTYRFYGMPAKANSSEEDYFTSGFFYLEKRQPAQAYHLFAKALRESPSSLRNQVYTAWLAFVIEPNQAAHSYAMLTLIDQCRPGFLAIQAFLAALESHLSQPEKALQRLDDISEEVTNTLLYRKLYRNIKRTKPLPLLELHQLS